MSTSTLDHTSVFFFFKNPSGTSPNSGRSPAFGSLARQKLAGPRQGPFPQVFPAVGKLGARTLLVTKGIATRSKKLLVAPVISISSKKLLGTRSMWSV